MKIKKKMSFKTDLRSRLMKLNRNQAHYGPPVKLFGDKDKDKVSNVFDCKPFNKKKQDVISPVSYGSPMGEMYGRREGARQQAAYMRQVKEIQRLEEQRLAELQRLSNVQVIDRTVTTEGKDYLFNPYTDKYVRMGGKTAKNVALRVSTDIQTAVPGTSTARAAVKSDKFRTIIRKTATGASRFKSSPSVSKQLSSYKTTNK